jgi:hypothetical protein
MALHTFLCESCRVLGLKQNALKESCLNLYSNVLPSITLTKLQHFGEEQSYMLLVVTNIRQESSKALAKTLWSLCHLSYIILYPQTGYVK